MSYPAELLEELYTQAPGLPPPPGQTAHGHPATAPHYRLPAEQPTLPAPPCPPSLALFIASPSDQPVAIATARAIEGAAGDRT